MKRYTVCLVMLAAVLTLTVFAAADQEVSGTLHRDKTWSGTIRVTGDVYVSPGCTLTILPGTDVRFAPRQDTAPHSQGIYNCPAPKAELIVEGTLRAQGTEDQPILFTSDSATPSPGDWGGIVLHGCATPVTLSHLVIEYADVNLTVFNSVTIEHCVIRNAYGGLDDCPSAQHWDVRIGLNLGGEGIVVRECEIVDNTWGCTINQGENGPAGTATQILGCSIYNNNVTSPGFDVPNGIHVFQSNAHIEGNTIANNTWGIEIGISNVVIIDNLFVDNDFGVVIYSPDGPSEGYVFDNDAINNGMDYVRMTHTGPEPMPEDWFQYPFESSGDAPNGANGDTAFTRIVVDGQAGDWSEYPTLRLDGQADISGGGFDLRSVRAFTNDKYLYLMLDAYGAIGEYVQIDLDIDVDGDGDREYMATFRPRTGRRDFGDFTSGQGIWNSMEGGDAAEGKVVELKMPLTLIEGYQSFSLGVRVMNGVCCEEEWYSADGMGWFPIPHLAETELSLGLRFAAWLAATPTEPAGRPFVINATDERLAGSRALSINAAETTAYVIAEFSGVLSRVDIDPESPAFGAVTTIAEGLLILNDVAVNREETLAYVSREAGSEARGRTVITRVDLRTGEMAVVTDRIKQPSNIFLSQDESRGYIVDLASGERQRGGLYRVTLRTGFVEPITTGLNGPYAVAVNRAETLAYVVTEPARPGDYPRGSLLCIDIQTGQVSTVADKAIFGASSITLTADERLVLVTEFGHEGGCDGAISAINVDLASPKYGNKVILLSGLCGPHDIQLNKDETTLFFVEVDASRFSAVRVFLDQVLYP